MRNANCFFCISNAKKPAVFLGVSQIDPKLCGRGDAVLGVASMVVRDLVAGDVKHEAAGLESTRTLAELEDGQPHGVSRLSICRAAGRRCEHA